MWLVTRLPQPAFFTRALSEVAELNFATSSDEVKHSETLSQ